MCSKQNRRFKSKRFQHDYRINDSKTSTKYIYHMSVNVNLMVKNVIRIKNGRVINVGVSVKIWKNIMCAKNIIFGILLHVVAKMVNI